MKARAGAGVGPCAVAGSEFGRGTRPGTGVKGLPEAPRPEGRRVARLDLPEPLDKGRFVIVSAGPRRLEQNLTDPGREV
jgi:hypothetical protein